MNSSQSQTGPVSDPDGSDVLTAPEPAPRVRLAWRGKCLLLVMVLMAVLLATIAVTPSILERYPQQVGEALSELMGQTVTIGALEAEWNGLDLRLALTDAQLPNPRDPRSFVRLDNASLTLNPLAVVLGGLKFSEVLTVRDASFAITRGPEGAYRAAGVGKHPGLEETTGFSKSQADALVAWLLQQSGLRLESVTIIWDDQQSDVGPLRIEDVNLSTRFDGDRHRIEGSVAFPSDRGEITFAVDVTGDLTSSEWSGSLTVTAKRVDLGLLQQQDLAHVLNASGEISFDLTSNWESGRLRKAHGTTTIENATLGHEAWSTPVDFGSNQFSLKRDADGWKLDIDDVQLRTANGSWPRSSASFRLDTKNELPSLSGIIEYAKIEDILPLVAAVTRRGQEQIDGIRARGIHGELIGTEFSLGLSSDAPLSVKLDTDVNGLGVAPAGPMPGFTGASGRVEANGWQGRFELNGAPVAVWWADVDEPPAIMERATGIVRWKRGGTGMWLHTTGVQLDSDFLQLAVAGQIHLPPGTSDPIVDMAVRVRDVDLVQVIDEFPLERLFPRPGKWARRALLAGTLTDGRLIYRGRAGRFPFDGAKDGLDARLSFENVELQYLPTWPVVEALSGELVMTGPEVLVEVSSATSFDTLLTDATVRINELGNKHPLLTVNGQTTAPTQRLLQYVAATPLRSRFGLLIQDIRSKGNGALSLQLELPLGTKKPRTTGQVRLIDNTVDFKRLGMEFSKVNGKLQFSNKGVSTKAILGEYLGEPVLATAGPSPHTADVTRVELTGTADPSFMQRQLRQLNLLSPDADATVIASRFSGKTQWQASLDLPKSFGRDPAAIAHLRVKSSLEGMGVAVPSPFAKTPREVRELDVLTAFRQTPTREVTVRYGDARGVFELNKSDVSPRLLRGTVVFGDQPIEVSDTPGLRITGSLSEFSADDWLSFFAPTPGEARLPTNDKVDPTVNYPLLQVLSDVDLTTKRLKVAGHWFDEAVLRVVPESGRWLATVSSDSLRGNVHIPVGRAAEPVLANFERCYIDPTDDGSVRESKDPRKFPPIRFSCDEFQYEDLTLGRIELTTSTHPYGLRVDSLLITSENFEARSIGTWIYEGDTHSSQFVTEVRGDDLGKLLASFGYEAGSTTGGTTEILLNSAWDGPPSRLSLSSMSGILHFSAKQGRLLDINPGATGRVFGLLTLSSLPRRLRFDFSDLFEEGLAYEQIEGSFSIEDGNAYTNDLQMESDAARIDIAGRTGLVNEDYDQIVTVTPKVSSSLPGAPLKLIEKLFRTNMDKVFAFQYTVTGSWEDPDVERIVIEVQPPG